jgi:hypothetical protein
MSAKGHQKTREEEVDHTNDGRTSWCDGENSLVGMKQLPLLYLTEPCY